jgi:hypothetical protein
MVHGQETCAGGITQAASSVVAASRRLYGEIGVTKVPCDGCPDKTRLG